MGIIWNYLCSLVQIWTTEKKAYWFRQSCLFKSHSLNDSLLRFQPLFFPSHVDSFPCWLENYSDAENRCFSFVLYFFQHVEKPQFRFTVTLKLSCQSEFRNWFSFNANVFHVRDFILKNKELKY